MKRIICFLLIVPFLCFGVDLTSSSQSSTSLSNTDTYKGVDERDKLNMFKVAILPFDIGDVKVDRNVDLKSLQAGIDQTIVSQFTQSRKFRVSNRNAKDEKAYEKEIKRIINSDTDNENYKLNNRIGADFILTGDIIDLSLDKKKTSYYGEDFASWRVSISVAYRMLELATMEVKWSNVVTINVPTNIANEYLDYDGGGYIRIVNYLANQVGDTIANQIIGAIYPLQVLKVDRGEVYFNQGGNRIVRGSVYEVREKGGTSIDDATGQHIVLDSKVLAKVRITDVMPKYSIGIVIDGSLSKIQKNSRAYLTNK